MEGIFWVVNDELVAFPFGTVNSVNGIAKSGNTYNHKRLWNDLCLDNKHPYNYYPRGRVVIDNKGKYSLQGTTQGRYLTGGVPPVRFSM